jgi:hypothetical protein
MPPCKRDCGPDICNEKSGRCVSRTGRIGRQILAAAAAAAAAPPQKPAKTKKTLERSLAATNRTRSERTSRKRATVAAAAASPHKFLSLAHGKLLRDTFAVPPSTVLVFLTTAGSYMMLSPPDSGVFTRPEILDEMIFQRRHLFSVVYAPGETVHDMNLTFAQESDYRTRGPTGLYPLPLRAPLACSPRRNAGWSGTTSPRANVTPPGEIRLSQALSRYHAAARATPDAPLVVFVGSCRYTDDDDVYEACAARNRDAAGWCPSQPRVDTTSLSLAEARRVSKNLQMQGWW